MKGIINRTEKRGDISTRERNFPLLRNIAINVQTEATRIEGRLKYDLTKYLIKY